MDTRRFPSRNEACAQHGAPVRLSESLVDLVQRKRFAHHPVHRQAAGLVQIDVAADVDGRHAGTQIAAPDLALLAEVVADGTATRGIALCGSGIGISIAVNRNPHVRCALVSEPFSAELAREHNDANVIAMGARLTGIDMAKACVRAFLATEFAGGRHQRRVDKLYAPPSKDTA